MTCYTVKLKIFICSCNQCYVLFNAASLLAFDQYGQLSAQLETESALRERAESVATQVQL